MANWDEDSGYYCLLIAILCNLDVYESILMYKYARIIHSARKS